jgi:hypothetical protein
VQLWVRGSLQKLFDTRKERERLKLFPQFDRRELSLHFGIGRVFNPLFFIVKQVGRCFFFALDDCIFRLIYHGIDFASSRNTRDLDCRNLSAVASMKMIMSQTILMTSKKEKPKKVKKKLISSFTVAAVSCRVLLILIVAIAAIVVLLTLTARIAFLVASIVASAKVKH